MDGISQVSRQAIKALGACRPGSTTDLEIWSLIHNSPNMNPAGDSTRFRSARASRIRFISWAGRASFRPNQDTLVLAMHLQLAPVTLPLVATGARLAVFLHGIEAWTRLSRLQNLALRRACLLSNSQYCGARFKAANPDYAGRDIQVCHLGVPAQTEEPENGEPLGNFALMVGRISADERYKGHDTLLELWPQLSGAVPGARLVIAGEGDDRKRLESKATDLGLRDRVKFLGRVSDARLAALYRDCSFFVMPSSNEGFGLVFVEAMRAGKACIGGYGAPAEVIEHGVTGLLVEPAEPGQILAALLRLFQEPAARESMGRAGRARFLREFTDTQFKNRLRMSLDLPSVT